MKKELKKFKKIVAIVPDYNKEGENTCHIIFKNGTRQTLTMKVSKVLRKGFRQLNMDLCSRRVWANNLLSKRNLNPIIISPNISLLPVKTRQAIGSKDGCYGYINYEATKSFNEDRLLLKGGTKIKYLSSMKTLQNKFRDADYLKSTYEKQLIAEYEACMAQEGNFTGPKDETKEAFII